MIKPILTRRKGKKKVSLFKCRKGTHDYIDIGGFQIDSSKIQKDEGKFSYRWCTTCGVLEETIYPLDSSEDNEPVVIIRVPDTGI